jgi:hypothetical protein
MATSSIVYRRASDIHAVELTLLQRILRAPTRRQVGWSDYACLLRSYFLP